MSVMVQAIVRGEIGTEKGGAKPDEIKHLQNNFYQSSLARTKSIFIYFLST